MQLQPYSLRGLYCCSLPCLMNLSAEFLAIQSGVWALGVNKKAKWMHLAVHASSAELPGGTSSNLPQPLLLPPPPPPPPPPPKATTTRRKGLAISWLEVAVFKKCKTAFAKHMEVKSSQLQGAQDFLLAAWQPVLLPPRNWKFSWPWYHFLSSLQRKANSVADILAFSLLHNAQGLCSTAAKSFSICHHSFAMLSSSLKFHLSSQTSRVKRKKWSQIWIDGKR